eukprot:1556594-Amphidinium_carterae.2
MVLGTRGGNYPGPLFDSLAVVEVLHANWLDLLEDAAGVPTPEANELKSPFKSLAVKNHFIQ